MRNCGRCGKPIYNPGEAICAGCKRVISADHGRSIDKENRKQELTEKLYESMANHGKEDNDDKYDLDFWGLGAEHDKYHKRGKRR